MNKVFASIKNVPQRNKMLKLLAFLVSAVVPTAETPVPAGFAFVPEKDAAVLAKSEPTFFTVDAATKDPSGNVKVTALQPAIDAQTAISGAAASAPAESQNAAPVTFEIEDGFVVPERKRGGAKADIYPFEKMAVGQSFFVAATEAKPTPAKSLASTVSSATKRYKDETPARKFTVRARLAGETEGSPNGKPEASNGARVYRIA